MHARRSVSRAARLILIVAVGVLVSACLPGSGTSSPTSSRTPERAATATPTDEPAPGEEPTTEPTRTSNPAPSRTVGPAPTPTIAPAAATTRKYLLLVYNPILEIRGGQRLIDYERWGDPAQLTADYVAAIISSLQFGNIGVPGNYVDQAESEIGAYVNATIVEAGISIDSLALREGGIYFKGTWPKTITAGPPADGQVP
jgi:hypothetical protein